MIESINVARYLEPTQHQSNLCTNLKLKEKANYAIQNRKIFIIYGNGGYTIRKILKKLGWLEKLPSNRYENLQKLSQKLLIQNSYQDNNFEIVALSNLVKDYPPNLIWHPRKFQILRSMDVYRNRIKYRCGHLNFTTKVGLIACVENARKNRIDGWSEIQTPRVHRLAIHKERIDFLQDYRTTYCLILLKFITDTPPSVIFNKSGSISEKIIQTALTRIKYELDFRENGYIKSTSHYILLNKQFNGLTNEWKIFYKTVNNVVQGVCQIKIGNELTSTLYVLEAMHTTRRAMKYWPRLTWDGYKNLWILKPAASCRGNGIVIKQNFEDMIKFAKKQKKRHYIAQKYIERPLLIYNTKFDIRQYMLITITATSFNIWMYKNCYLRFCSEEFQLQTFRESGHITNNAIQKKYLNGARSSKLPIQNMWSLKEFQNYLKHINHNNVWDEKIYPEMKNNIKTVILSSLEDIDLIPKSFQLFGCDFMLDEYYKPILIEINSSPDMSSSTKITAKLCPEVLENLIQVVLDDNEYNNNIIGNFETIYSTDWHNHIKKIQKFDNTINSNTLLPIGDSLHNRKSQNFKFVRSKEKQTEKRKHQIENELVILRSRATSLSNYILSHNLSWRDIIKNKKIKVHKSELNVLYYMYNKKLQNFIQ